MMEVQLTLTQGLTLLDYKYETENISYYSDQELPRPLLDALQTY